RGVPEAAAPSPGEAERAERRGQEEGRDGEDDAKAGLPAALAPLLGGFRVDGVGAVSGKGREGVRAEVEVRVDVREVADEAGLEIAAHRPPGEQDREPVDHRHQSSEEPPDVEDEEMGDREDEAEGDGEARALEIVADDDADLLGRRLLGAGASLARRLLRLNRRRRPALLTVHWRATYK